MDDVLCGIRVPYSIRSVDFGGKGIFADAKIYLGSLVWEYRGGVNVSEYTGDAAAAHLENLSMSEAKHFLDTSYGLHDKLCVIHDDGKFMNHSTIPNCSTDMRTGNTYAIRDIEPDEQLFEDYQNFEHPIFLLALLQKYKCAPDYYDIPVTVE